MGSAGYGVGRIYPLVNIPNPNQDFALTRTKKTKL